MDFDLKKQKTGIYQLLDLVNHIESCNGLMDIDPEYYQDKKTKYMRQYSQLLESLLLPLTGNAKIMGDLPCDGPIGEHNIGDCLSNLDEYEKAISEFLN